MKYKVRSVPCPDCAAGVDQACIFGRACAEREQRKETFALLRALKREHELAGILKLEQRLDALAELEELAELTREI